MPVLVHGPAALTMTRVARDTPQFFVRAMAVTMDPDLLSTEPIQLQAVKINKA